MGGASSIVYAEAEKPLDASDITNAQDAIQEVQRFFLLRREGLGRIVALAPRRDDHLAAGLQHARHLLDVLFFVGHVLAALAAPDDVEAVVGEVHR